MDDSFEIMEPPDMQLRTLFFYYNHAKEDCISTEKWEIELMAILISIIFTILTYGLIWRDYSFFFLIPFIVWVGLSFFIYNKSRKTVAIELMRYYEDKINKIVGEEHGKEMLSFSNLREDYIKASLLNYLYVPMISIYIVISLISTYLSYIWFEEKLGVNYGLFYIIVAIVLHLLILLTYIKFKSNEEKFKRMLRSEGFSYA